LGQSNYVLRVTVFRLDRPPAFSVFLASLAFLSAQIQPWQSWCWHTRSRALHSMATRDIIKPRLV